MKRIVARGSGAVLVWGVNLTILWIVAWAVFDVDATTVVLGAWMAGSVVVWAAVTWWRERRAGTPADEQPLAVVDGSHATALLGVAIVAALLATQFGPWLAYVSAGLALVAAGGLVRERRAARASVEQVRAACGEERAT
ncbi:MAG TPA: hypothetical protein VNT54_04880 [Solirubrobacteraceae bacterium]|nr:hypothetical protein [Solirubrobacteraceae bacterium]